MEAFARTSAFALNNAKLRFNLAFGDDHLETSRALAA